MTAFRTLAIAATATLCAVLAGCGGPRLAAEAAPAAELQGTWRLDPAASDDARAIVAAALPKPRRAERPPPAYDPGGARSDGERGPPNDGAYAPTGAARRDPGAMVRSFVLPSPVLRIGGTPYEIVVSQDGRRRTFAPGDDTPYSITDRYGTRQVRAGWERDEFVIVSRDPRGLELTERFRRGAAPETLVSTVTLKARGIDTVRVSSLYRRSSGEPAPSPADEGPPAPLR